MKVKIDFQLNSQFEVVERIIFRLVLNGFTDINDICETMPIFSNTVIANGIKHLVNLQIICVDLNTSKLSLSDPIVAIIDTCINKEYNICVPQILTDELLSTGIILNGKNGIDDSSLKESLLKELIPNVNMRLYKNTLDFIIKGTGGNIDG